MSQVASRGKRNTNRKRIALLHKLWGVLFLCVKIPCSYPWGSSFRWIIHKNFLPLNFLSACVYPGLHGLNAHINYEFDSPQLPYQSPRTEKWINNQILNTYPANVVSTTARAVVPIKKALHSHATHVLGTFTFRINESYSYITF